LPTANSLQANAHGEFAGTAYSQSLAARKEKMNDLQILIQELQREHDYLENEMKSCIQEWDFKGAEAFSKPLIHTKDKLRILKNLDDPNYDKIMSLKARIERLNEFEIKDDFLKLSIDKMRARIPEYESELAELESSERKSHYDSDELIICLEKILSDEINQFRIENEEEGIAIIISKRDFGLRIEVKRTDKYSLEDSVKRNGLTEFKRMGFEVNENNAIKEFEEFQKSEILQIIKILSRITYEVFRLYGNKAAIIKFKK
jgi:hypothetical protein